MPPSHRVKIQGVHPECPNPRGIKAEIGGGQHWVESKASQSPSWAFDVVHGDSKEIRGENLAQINFTVRKGRNRVKTTKSPDHPNQHQVLHPYQQEPAMPIANRHLPVNRPKPSQHPRLTSRLHRANPPQTRNSDPLVTETHANHLQPQERAVWTRDFPH